MLKRLSIILLILLTFSPFIGNSLVSAQDNEDEEALENDLQLKLPNETDNPTFTLVFVDPSGNGVFLSVDGSEDKEVSSPYTLPSLGIGKHVLTFSYTDAEETESSYETVLVVVPRPPEINPPEVQDNKLLFTGTGLAASQLKLFLSGGAMNNREHTEVKSTGDWEYIVDGEFEEGIYTATAYVTKNGFGSELAEPVTFNVGTSSTAEGVETVEEAGQLDFALAYLMKSDFYTEYTNNTDFLLYTVLALVVGIILGILLHRFLFVRGEKNMEKSFKQMLSGDKGKKKEKKEKKEKKKDKDDKEEVLDIEDAGSATIIPLENDDVDEPVESEAPKEEGKDEEWIDVEVKEEDEIPVFNKESDEESSTEEEKPEETDEDKEPEPKDPEEDESREPESTEEVPEKEEASERSEDEHEEMVEMEVKEEKEKDKKDEEVKEDKKGIFSFLSRGSKKEEKKEKEKDEEKKPEEKDTETTEESEEKPTGMELEEWVEERRRIKEEEEASGETEPNEEEGETEKASTDEQKSENEESEEDSERDKEKAEEPEVTEEEPEQEAEEEPEEAKDEPEQEAGEEPKEEDKPEQKETEEPQKEQSIEDIKESDIPEGMTREEFLQKFKEHDPDPEEEEKTGDMKEKLEGGLKETADSKEDSPEKEAETKEASEEEQKEESEESEIDQALTNKLTNAGKTVDDVKDMSVKELTELEGIGKVTAENIYKGIHGKAEPKKEKPKKKKLPKKKKPKKAIKKRNIKISLTSKD